MRHRASAPLSSAASAPSLPRRCHLGRCGSSSPGKAQQRSTSAPPNCGSPPSADGRALARGMGRRSTPHSWPATPRSMPTISRSAEAHYREAARPGVPTIAAPLVGLARVAIAKTNVATDYNALPSNPALEKAAAAAKQAIKLDPTFAPAYTELGRALLILGKADEALAALCARRSSSRLAIRRPTRGSGWRFLRPGRFRARGRRAGQGRRARSGERAAADEPGTPLC